MMPAKILPKVVGQTAALILIAAVVGLGVNALRSDGISLVADWSPAGRLQAAGSNDDTAVSMDRAAGLHRTGDALFVDLRAPEAFAAGHIAGALNIPGEAVFDHLERLFRVVPDYRTAIIVYCDGDDSCAAAEDLALLLRSMGYADTGVLVNGWTLWQTHGYPIKVPTER